MTKQGNQTMKRIDKILANETFLLNLQKNEELEKTRIFCKHGMEHFLDVARIGTIVNLEEKIGVSKELIYAAALLHDIGKHMQYSDGTNHDEASADIAAVVLQECDFSTEETAKILDAILHHRDQNVSKEKNLKGILYRADKEGRPCFCCQAKAECNWSDEKKNLEIKY